jgi:hypothetical protein
MKNERWPWVEDPKGWGRVLIKTVKVVGLNGLVIFPIMVYLLQVIGGFNTLQSFELEDLPSVWTLIW